MLKILENKKIIQKPISYLEDLIKNWEEVNVDLGTGDALYIYNLARNFPDKLYIGIDASIDSMEYTSWKMLRKQEKGGLKNRNMLLINMAAESLNSNFYNLSDRLTINFPWGSLLKIVINPDSTFTKIIQMAKLGSLLTINLNYTVLQDTQFLQRENLPLFDKDYLENLLLKYQSLGFELLNYQFFYDDNIASSWGKRLTQGSKRETLKIELRKTFIE